VAAESLAGVGAVVAAVVDCKFRFGYRFEFAVVGCVGAMGAAAAEGAACSALLTSPHTEQRKSGTLAGTASNL
jgi:hypothetical protein